MTRRIGPKAVTWSVAELTAFDDETRYCLELTERQIASLLTVTTEQMAWGTRWFDAPSVEFPANYAARLSAALMSATRCDAPAGVNETSQMLNMCYTIEKQPKEEEVHTYQKFNGIWYVGLPCGDCGGIEWVALGEGASLSPDGAPVSPTSGGSSVTVEDIPTNDLACYQDAAFDYLSGRYGQWAEYVTGVSITALDAYLGPFDEALDIPDLVAVIANGQTIQQTIAGATAAQMRSVFNLSKATAGAAWNYGGNITRADLVSWCDNFPLFDQGLATREIIRLWARFANIATINDDLAALRSQCINGTSVITLPPPIVLPPQVGEFELSGTDYAIYEIFASQTFGAGQTFTFDVPANTEFIYLDYQQSVNGVTNYELVNGGSTQNYGTATPNDGSWWAGSPDVNLRNAFAANSPVGGYNVQLEKSAPALVSGPSELNTPFKAFIGRLYAVTVL